MIDKITKLCSSEKVREFIRFCIVGVIATGIHYGLYLLFSQWIEVNISYTIGYVLSFVVNFLLTNYFTFKTNPNAKRGMGFALSHFVNYCLHMLLLNVVLFLGIPKALAPIPVYMVVIPVNFFLIRFFFNKK